MKFEINPRYTGCTNICKPAKQGLHTGAIQRPVTDEDQLLIFRAIMFKPTANPDGQRFEILEVRKRNQGYSFPALPAVAEGFKVWRSVNS